MVMVPDGWWDVGLFTPPVPGFQACYPTIACHFIPLLPLLSPIQRKLPAVLVEALASLPVSTRSKTTALPWRPTDPRQIITENSSSNNNTPLSHRHSIPLDEALLLVSALPRSLIHSFYRTSRLPHFPSRHRRHSLDSYSHGAGCLWLTSLDSTGRPRIPPQTQLLAQTVPKLSLPPLPTSPRSCWQTRVGHGDAGQGLQRVGGLARPGAALHQGVLHWFVGHITPTPCRGTT